MSSIDWKPSGSIALLDTSIQIDRKKMRARAEQIDRLLSKFDFTVTTSICLLEFKATIIGECITIHNNLRLKRRFTLVRDSLLEKKHRQTSLRAHIFNNLLDTFASSFEITDRDDERLATKARLKLEQDIPSLYDWFVLHSVDAVLRQGIQCTRAAEKPDKAGKVSFSPNLPQCKRGKNKTCRVEAFIRQHADRMAPALKRVIGQIPEDKSHQLTATCEVFDRVVKDSGVELSHGDCRRAGDCLIALEGMEHATHAFSTNATEWEQLSEILGIEFVRVRYDNEETR